MTLNNLTFTQIKRIYLGGIIEGFPFNPFDCKPKIYNISIIVGSKQRETENLQKKFGECIELLLGGHYTMLPLNTVIGKGYILKIPLLNYNGINVGYPDVILTIHPNKQQLRLLKLENI